MKDRNADYLPRVVVAIPVMNEEERIASCLEALDRQIAGRADDIILLLNNCTDRTASIVQDLRLKLSTNLHIVEVQFSADIASAGYARSLACGEALRLAGEHGVILTTDADGQVGPDWIGENLRAIRAGADAVAGFAELDPKDRGNIPLQLHEDDARECAYDTMCDELHALLDPDPADPPPRHTQASGASLAVTARVFLAAGGMPAIAFGEDRAFIAALRRVDARVRRSLACRVMVSGRIEGRAVGGMADTIKRRLAAPDLFLDDRLEPAEDCARRAALRRFARNVYNGTANPAHWWREFRLDEHTAKGLIGMPSFGAAWDALEKRIPILSRRRVPVAELPRQQMIGNALLARARQDPVAYGNTLLAGIIHAPVQAIEMSDLGQTAIER